MVDRALPGTDWWGRRVCGRCQLVGRPGDAHHTEDLADTAVDLAAYEARRLGERVEHEDITT